MRSEIGRRRRRKGIEGKERKGIKGEKLKEGRTMTDQNKKTANEDPESSQEPPKKKQKVETEETITFDTEMIRPLSPHRTDLRSSLSSFPTEDNSRLQELSDVCFLS